MLSAWVPLSGCFGFIFGQDLIWAKFFCRIIGGFSGGICPSLEYLSCQNHAFFFIYFILLNISEFLIGFESIVHHINITCIFSFLGINILCKFRICQMLILIFFLIHNNGLMVLNLSKRSFNMTTITAQFFLRGKKKLFIIY